MKLDTNRGGHGARTLQQKGKTRDAGSKYPATNSALANTYGLWYEESLRYSQNKTGLCRSHTRAPHKGQ